MTFKTRASVRVFSFVNNSMKTIILLLIKKFLTPEKVAQLLAQIIAYLLRKASKTKNWDVFKNIVQRVEYATHLFNACYDDDEMDEEDEDKIAEAIEQITDKVDVNLIIEAVTKK